MFQNREYFTYVNDATVVFKGEDFPSPTKTKLTVKGLDPPDRFRVINFPEVPLGS